MDIQFFQEHFGPIARRWKMAAPLVFDYYKALKRIQEVDQIPDDAIAEACAKLFISEKFLPSVNQFIDLAKEINRAIAVVENEKTEYVVLTPEQERALYEAKRPEISEDVKARNRERLEALKQRQAETKARLKEEFGKRLWGTGA